MKIIRSKTSLATLHNRRDFGKRYSTLEKFASEKELAIKDFNLSEAAFRERITSKNEKNN